VAQLYATESGLGLKSGLVSYYPLSSPGSQTDIVGGYNLTLTDGTAVTCPGVGGNNGITTSGGDHYLHSSTFPSSMILTNSKTLSIWIKGNQSPWGNQSSVWGMGGSQLEVNGTLLVTTGTAAGNINTGVPINTSVWTQVVVTQTASQVNVYTNGVLAYAYAETLQVNGEAASGLSLSANPYGYPAPGSFDDFAIWSRALSDSEVAQLYATESTAPTPPILNVEKVICLSSSNLQFGVTYQVQSSSDLTNWTNLNPVFTATTSAWTNYFPVNNWNLFYRIQQQ
jgi:hypothetical protein